MRLFSTPLPVMVPRLRLLRETVQTPLNLELAVEDDVIRIAFEVGPDQVTLVPEKREEVTTEGGLDVAGNFDSVRVAADALADAGIVVSLFLDPEPEQIEAAARMGVAAVELHTGQYALSAGDDRQVQLELLEAAGRQIVDAGMLLHAGHGLNYRNVQPVALIDQMAELNIGHSIVARAVMVGIGQAVREMKQLIEEASTSG